MRLQPQKDALHVEWFWKLVKKQVLWRHLMVMAQKGVIRGHLKPHYSAEVSIDWVNERHSQFQVC